jgi:S1-C subfamily serine protease
LPNDYYPSIMNARRTPNSVSEPSAALLGRFERAKLRFASFYASHPLALTALTAIVSTVFVLAVYHAAFARGAATKLTQEDIDAAVEHSLTETVLPSPAVRAYETILPSVVRIESFVTDPKTNEEKQFGVGTGVVIVNDGTILTNLHVVQGAQRVQITFMDGHQTVGVLQGVRPEHDLAVMRAKVIPDDLFAATMASTANLKPGDHVFAVGFPFGIGPSISAGIVSGLKREFKSPEGGHSLSNLIQFDAAANPGNSGGPLVTASGEVVGIVTAILNPNEDQRTFVGIGFAVPIENAASAVGLAPF